MKAVRTCSQCHGELSGDAPEGLCPKCLLKLGGVQLGIDVESLARECGVRDEELAGRDPMSKGGSPGPGVRLDRQKQQFGNYEILKKIGEGGMGTVYRARQLNLDRLVALKLLPFRPWGAGERIERFRTEAAAAAALQHPNIVAVHDVGEFEGQPFFSMELVEGCTLADLVRDQPLPARRAAGYLRTIAEAVHYAHQHGILHRDLKPSNVLIDAFDQPRITDFGLAKRLGRDSDLTLTGQVLGSPNFISPEQAEGRSAAVGPRSDVYSLGALLYHLLTRQPPFQAETLTTLLKQVLEAEPVPPRSLNPSIPKDLETICLKCLEKEPARRYVTAKALAEDLGRFLNHEPVLARPVGAPGKTWRWCRRQPVKAGLVAALNTVFVAGTIGVFWQWRQAQANAQGELHQRQAAVAAGEEAKIREYTANLTLAQNSIQAQQFGQAQDTLVTRTPESYRGWEWGWLLRSCCQDLMTLSGDSSLGVEAVFSPDSRFLLTSGFANVIKIWDLANGEAVGQLTNHTGVANMTSFSPNGLRVCTYSWAPFDPTARIWEMDNPQKPRPLFRPLVHTNGISYSALSRDGHRLAVAGADGKVRIFDVTSGADTGLVNDYGDSIVALAFSPDGQRLAYGGGTWFWTRSLDTSIHIWDLTTGQTRRLPGHQQAVFGLAWSPDGVLLVSCGWDGQVKAWDPVSGRELLPFVASPKQRVACRADFSPNGQLLGVVGLDDPNPTARATLFDVRTRRVVRELAGHTRAVQGIRFSSDGKYIATSASDLTVKIWPVPEPPGFLSLEGHSQVVWTAAFSPDGRRVATGSLDQTARIWDATTGDLLRTFEVRFPVVSLAFSHDGQRLATVGPENSACVWDLAAESHRSSRREEARPHTPTPDRSLLASAATTEESLRLRGHARAVLAVAWSPDDRWIATASKDATARISDANSGALRLSLSGHSNSVQAVAFSPDGNVLATGGADGAARLWSTLTGQCLRVLTNHAGGVLSLAFSPRGRLLATGGTDCTVRLWDTDTGRQIHCLSGHVNGVNSVAFSPDGQRLLTVPGGTDLQASVNREFRVFLWDVASGHRLFTLAAHDNAIYTAAFSADGRRLVTAGGDHTARIWTAFPWRSADYPGETNSPLDARIEQFKRQFWKKALAADAGPRPWTNGFRVYHHVFGDMNLPPAGSKRQPLFPIPPRLTQAGPNQPDLGSVYNVALNESWQPIANLTDVDFNLAALPAGLQTYEGVTFDVRGIVQLRGGAPDSELYPERVAVQVKRAFRRFHVLHGTSWAEREGREIGSFVLHYADGAAAEIPIRYGEHVRDQNVVSDTRADCSGARVAWCADPSHHPADPRPRLYQATFANPKPELEVVSVDYVSKVTRCAPFLIAFTVE